MYNVYMQVFNIYTKMYNDLNKTTGDSIMRGKHNYLSPIVILLPNNAYDDIYIPVYRKYLKDNFNLDIDSLFISYIDKCTNQKLNTNALILEMKIRKKGLFLLHDFNGKFAPGINHVYLNNLTEEDLLKELEKNTELIRKYLR